MQEPSSRSRSLSLSPFGYVSGMSMPEMLSSVVVHARHYGGSRGVREMALGLQNKREECYIINVEPMGLEKDEHVVDM